MGNQLFVHRLEDRVGASSYTNMSDRNVGQVWLRTEGGKTDFKDNSKQVKTDGERHIVHGGIGLVNLGEQDQVNIGAMAAYAQAESDSQSALTQYTSRSEVEGYGVGLYGTWLQNPANKTGAYADVWFMWNKFDNQVSGQDLAIEKYDSSGLTASAEVGSTVKLAEQSGRSYWVQPQAQIVYQGVKLDNFTENTDTVIQQSDANIQTRLGAKAYVMIPTAVASDAHYRPYVAVNWINNSNSNAVKLDGTRAGLDGDRNIGELKLGIEGQTSKNSHAWINMSFQEGSNDYSDVIGSLGWKLLF